MRALHDLRRRRAARRRCRAACPTRCTAPDEATRRYVADYRRLTSALLAAGRELRPDLIVQNGRELTFRDGAGRPAYALIGVLENGSAEAPFTAWASVLGGPRRRRAAPRQPRPRAARLQRAGRAARAAGGGRTTSRRSASCAACASTSTTPTPRTRCGASWTRSRCPRPTRRSCSASRARRSTAGWRAACPPSARRRSRRCSRCCDLLQRKLKADRLPGVARRPADAYGGRTMLELIAADRHGELLAERPRELRLADRPPSRRWRTGETARRGGGAYNRLAEPAWADPLDISFARRPRRPLERSPGSYGALYLNAGRSSWRARRRDHKLAGQPYGVEDLDESEQHDLVEVAGARRTTSSTASPTRASTPSACPAATRSPDGAVGHAECRPVGGGRHGTPGGRAWRAGPRRRRAGWRRSWRSSTPRRPASS